MAGYLSPVMQDGICLGLELAKGGPKTEEHNENLLFAAQALLAARGVPATALAIAGAVLEYRQQLQQQELLRIVAKALGVKFRE